MSIKIEPGKSYRVRNGERWYCAGFSQREGYPFVMRGKEGYDYDFTADGKMFAGVPSDFDVVAEWTEPDAPPTEQPETLRDRFAMAALTGMLAATAHDSNWPSPAEIATRASEYADAMMEAREK